MPQELISNEPLGQWTSARVKDWLGLAKALEINAFQDTLQVPNTNLLQLTMNIGGGMQFSRIDSTLLNCNVFEDNGNVKVNIPLPKVWNTYYLSVVLKGKDGYISRKNLILQSSEKSFAN